ncbi:MAG: hypothetical protein N3A66_02485, partial [Planctomycetota bacterium]|nr:hypothetical protein [Planctomycetota bacterium]
MTLTRFILRHLRYRLHRHLLMALVTAVSAATISGSLRLGASVRQALKSLALERLGRIACAVESSAAPFGISLAERLKKKLSDTSSSLAVSALLRLEGAAQSESGHTCAATLYGIKPEEFRAFFADAATSAQRQAEQALALIKGEKAVVNDALANALCLKIGDHIAIALPNRVFAPARTIFGKRRASDTVRHVRLAIAAIIPVAGPGRFSLSAAPEAPRLVLADREWLANQISWEEQANLLLVGSSRGNGEHRRSAAAVKKALGEVIALEDVGLKAARLANDKTLIVLPKNSFILPEELLTASRRWPALPEPVCAYLANEIALANHGASAPYSVILGLTNKTISAECGLELAAGEALVNQWLAKDLGCKLGDLIRLAYYV